MSYPYASDRDEILSRLKKIEGQVRGVQRMVTDDTACVDVLTQVAAVISGMEKVGLRLVREQARTTISEAIAAKGDAKGNESKVDELVRIVERFLQS